jgi:oxygen-independent coproporphyrinogen-3 oxidase
VKQVEQAVSPIAQTQDLTKEDVRAESLFLGLRLMRGVSLDLCKEYETDLERFREAGLLEIDGELIKLTRSGALLSNEVFAAFV